VPIAGVRACGPPLDRDARVPEARPAGQRRSRDAARPRAQGPQGHSEDEMERMIEKILYNSR